MLMRRKIFCLTVIFLGMVATATTACSNAFGDNCEYQCHCAGGVSCGTEGSCPNRLCASGWEGEYCQRGNVAAGKSSSTSQSSTNDSYYASLALDGDMNQAFSKCSHTNTENQPWWQVDLGREFVLFTVKVVNVISGDVRECKTSQKGTEYRGTMSTTRNGYTCADWLDETIHDHSYKPANSFNYCRNPDNTAGGPWCYITNSNKRWENCNVQICYTQLKNLKIGMDNNLCRHYKGPIGFGKAVDIRCDTPVVGRHLKIQLMDWSTVLTLCEVTVQAFQYRVCPNKYYGPNCNNQCQCANDVPCYDDKTGRCPSGTCNDRFSGRYCNIGIPQVLKDGPSTPTSIRVKWQEYIIHDSAYDSGEFERLSLRYYEPSSTSISIKTGYDNASLPSPSMIKYNVPRLNPSTLYSLYVELTYKHLTGSVAKKGPTANFSTESCASYMATPMITQWESVTEASPWPNRVYLTIRAHVPDMIAGCFKELDVYVKKTNESKYMMTSTGADRIFKIKGLTAFTEYDIKATVRSPDDQTKDSFLKIRTAEDVPSAPTIAKAGASPTSVSIRITPPDPPYGVITNYEIEMWKAGSSGNMYSYGPTNLTHTFNELKLNTTYKLKAQAFTSAGGGVWSKVISIITVENIPGPPNTLLAQEHTTNSFVLVWTKPKYPNGILGSYKGICTPLFSYDDEVNTKWMNYAKEFNPGPEVENVKVSHLTPATEYNCSVAAHTTKGFGPSVWLRNWTKPEEAVVPEDLFLSITPGKTTNSTITVKVANMPKSLKTGSISKVRIAVERQETRRKRSTPLLKEDHGKLTNHATAKEKGYPGYIAAELAANFSGPFVIGDGKTYGGYSNPPLTKGQKYDVIFGMVFAVGEETTIAYRRYGQYITVKGAPSLNVVALAVGLAGGVVVLAVIIIPVVIIMRKKRRAKGETAESLDTQLNDISSPTIIPELERVEPDVPDNKTAFPDGPGVGETNLAAIGQQDETVYEVVPTNNENPYELTDAGMSSGREADFNSESKRSDTTDEPTYMYADTERDSRVAQANIYEEPARFNHQQTAYETFEKDTTDEPTYMYADTERDSKVAQANIYEEPARVNHQQTAYETFEKDTTDEPTYMYADTERNSRVAVANIYDVPDRVNHQQTTYETFDKDRTNEAKQSSLDGGYEDPRFGQSDTPEDDAAASDTCEHEGDGQESKNTYQNLSEALDVTNDDGTYENLAYSP